MDNKIKHLEFIQDIIDRQARNYFLLKGWVITLVAASFALSVKDEVFKDIFEQAENFKKYAQII